jgi:hypothetical protein
VGQLPPKERIAELEERLAEWEQLPTAERGDPTKGEGTWNAFDHAGPQAWRGGLTGADVFQLAAREFTSTAEEAALEPPRGASV